MTVREIIRQFKHFSEDRTGFVSDDTIYSDKAIYHNLLISRSRIISDRDKLGSFSKNMEQSLTCIELSPSDIVECKLIIPSGCKIMKSVCDIPNPLKVVSITTHMGESIEIIEWNRVATKLNSNIKEVKNSRYAAIRNINGKQYLYIFNELHLRNITMNAIFEDPTKAAAFCGDNEAKCNPLEVDFHTDLKYVEPILKLTVSNIFGMRSGSTVDVNNNDQELV